MTGSIPINLAVEDTLSEAVLRRIIGSCQQSFAVGSCYMHSGFGYLRKTIRGFNSAARGTPFLVLTDLDAAECAPELMRDWLTVPKHPNLLFRVAVRQVEAWLLGHRDAFARFAGIRAGLVPRDVDGIEDAKRCLIDLVAKSSRRDLRRDIVPQRGSTARQGPNYNGRLIGFVDRDWDARSAMSNSPSPRRALSTLDVFEPQSHEPDGPR